jgi:hypothetical protein
VAADARAVQVATDADRLTVELVDRRVIRALWIHLGTLRTAAPAMRLRCDILDEGRTIGFPI